MTHWRTEIFARSDERPLISKNLIWKPCGLLSVVGLGKGGMRNANLIESSGCVQLYRCDRNWSNFRGSGTRCLHRRAWRTRGRWRSIPPQALLRLRLSWRHLERLPTGLDRTGRQLCSLSRTSWSELGLALSASAVKHTFQAAFGRPSLLRVHRRQVRAVVIGGKMLPAPIFLRLARDRWRFRIFDFHPMRRPAGAVR